MSETVADLDPDRIVHYVSRTGSSTRKVHTDDDCRHLEQGTSQFSNPARVLDQDRRVCAECLGTHETGTPEGTDVQATRKALLKTDPEDAGLSTLDESKQEVSMSHD